MDYDTIIVGGGPAGLSAALVLGRSRRKVLIFDHEQYRNQASKGVHCFLSRDGILPEDLRSIARDELKPFAVTYKKNEIIEARNIGKGFEVVTKEGSIVSSRTLLIATGVIDELPKIPGIEECYGKSVHHCPYCDGWEVRDKRIAILARGKSGLVVSSKLKNWSASVFLCTNGRPRYTDQDRQILDKLKVELHSNKISRIASVEGMVQAIEFEDGSSLACDTIFFSTGQTQSTSLAESLGCKISPKGVVLTGRTQKTCVDGLFVAGDAAKDMQFAIVAAAEGAKAAVEINEMLIEIGYARLEAAVEQKSK